MTAPDMESRRTSWCGEHPVSGRVEALLEGGLMRVSAEGGAWVCRKALGCMLEPCPGDLVALHAGSDGLAHVLAVLERSSAEPVRMRFDRPLKMDVGGSFELRVSDGTHLHSGKRLQLDTEQLCLHADTMDLVVRAMQGLVAELSLQSSGMKLVAEAVETVAARLTQALGHSFRTVDGIDHVRAGEMDHAAQGQMRLHGRNTLLTAELLSKIDAAQIHLG